MVCWGMNLNLIHSGRYLLGRYISKLPIQGSVEIPAGLQVHKRYAFSGLRPRSSPRLPFHQLLVPLPNNSRMQGGEKIHVFLFSIFSPASAHHHSALPNKLLKQPVIVLNCHFIFLLTTAQSLACTWPAGWPLFPCPTGDHLAFWPG